MEFLGLKWVWKGVLALLSRIRNSKRRALIGEAQAKLSKILTARKNLQQAQTQAIRSGVTNIGDSFEIDGNDVSELNRYAKETGKSLRTGKPTSTGGKYGGSDVNSKAMRHVLKSMGAGRAGVQPRGKKKVPGQKPPAAGEYGAPASPAQKVAKRRAAAQRAQAHCG